MPIQPSTPSTAAPTDRLSLTTESARGEQASGSAVLCGCGACAICFADDPAPSSRDSSGVLFCACAADEA